MLFGAINAPILPLGNGLISVAMFENEATGDFVVLQQSDNVYEEMGEQGGYSKNPTLDGYTWKRSFQYPADFKQPTPEEMLSATSSQISRPTPRDLYVAVELQKYKDDDNISVVQAFGRAVAPGTAHAAIALDATSTSGVTTATSQTWAHTMSAGANTILVVYGFVRSTDSTNLSTAKYNGVLMSTTTPAWADYLEGRYGWIMHLAAPASGANNIVTTFNASLSTTFAAISYTGAKQTGIPDSAFTDPGDGGSNNFSLATTVVADNSWTLLSWLGVDGMCSAATSPAVLRNTSNPGQADSNGPVAAGSRSIAVTGCGNRIQVKGIISIAPAVAAAAGSGSTQDLILIQE